MVEGKTGGWPRKKRAVTATILAADSPDGRQIDHVPIPDWNTNQLKTFWWKIHREDPDSAPGGIVHWKNKSGPALRRTINQAGVRLCCVIQSCRAWGGGWWQWGEKSKQTGNKGEKKTVSHHETPQMRGGSKGKAHPHCVSQAFLPALFLMNKIEQHMQVEARTVVSESVPSGLNLPLPTFSRKIPGKKSFNPKPSFPHQWNGMISTSLKELEWRLERIYANSNQHSAPRTQQVCDKHTQWSEGFVIKLYCASIW